MNSFSPTTVNGEKTVSPPRPARSNGVSSPCVFGNDQNHPIKVAIVETQTPRGFLSTQKKETPEPPQMASSVLSPSDQRAGSAIQLKRSSSEQGLLIDVAAVRKALLRMVITLAENFHAREDLMQEALLYFWLTERQHPGQRRSWYLQGVKFHLNDLRNSGRSLDSPKRRGAQASFADNCDGWDRWRDSLEIDEGIMSAVNAHDVFSVLVDRLMPIDQTILVALAEGTKVGDIAEKLHMRRGFVESHRLRIAKLAVKLGINPLPANPLRRGCS